MRNKNWTIMMGRVKLKSKRAAFSISAAREGGAKDKVVTVKREIDLRVVEESEGICWVFKNFGVGSFGRESCGICLSLGLEKKDDEAAMEKKSENGSNMGMSASLLAAACAATMSSPAIALVDERMSTEGTGLPFGLSNNLLGWILFGVFGLIWALYFIYTASLEEDEESGLSL